MKNIIIISIAFLIFFTCPVFAYFDPGLGSSIIQGFAAIISIIILYIKNPKFLIIDVFNFFKKKFSKRKKNN